MPSFNQLIKNANICELQSGDVLFLDSKSKWFDRLIKFFARSKFTHTAMLVEIKGSWFVVESKPKSQQHDYQMMPADWWIERNKDKEAYFGKMPASKDSSMENQKNIEAKIKETILNPKWSVRPYSFVWLLVTYILQELLGVKRPNFMKSDDESKNPTICSTLVQEAWESADVIEKGNFQCIGDIENLVQEKNRITPLFVPQNKSCSSNFLPPNYKISNFSMATVS